MPETKAVIITESLSIPISELTFSASRAGGPGGQHVNRSATKVELRWVITDSLCLSEPQRQLLLTGLASRLDTTGGIRIVAGNHRSQFRNRQAAIERLRVLVARALREPPVRIPTKPTPASRIRRLKQKAARSDLKRQRRTVSDD